MKTTINPYLTFDGNCEEAFHFYKSVFGGDFTSFNRFSEMPPNPNMHIDEKMKEKMMHISLPIGEECILMGCDSSDSFGHARVAGDNFSISINTDSVAEVKRVYNALSEGGMIKMALEKAFWGSYFAMFTDKFGIHWMVNCELNEQ